MRSVVLPGTNLKVSRFSFGTASLLKVGSSRERYRLLSLAHQSGFTHFDTAPYYGFGVAERDLRPLLAANPDITVATKVGIYSPGGESQSSASVYVRKVGGKIFPALSRSIVDWSVDRARRALSGSLKRLGRDRIDLYMLHEPDYSLLDTDEWLRWLEDERQHVAWFGIALDTARLAPFLRNESRLASIIQTFDSIAGHEADVILKTGRPLQVTYGYVSSFEGRRSEDVGAVLASALQRNATGSIIVSTAKAERLSQYRNAVELADRQISGA